MPAIDRDGTGRDLTADELFPTGRKSHAAKPATRARIPYRPLTLL